MTAIDPSNVVPSPGEKKTSQLVGTFVGRQADAAAHVRRIVFVLSCAASPARTPAHVRSGEEKSGARS